VANGSALAALRSPDGLLAAIVEWKRTRSSQATIDDVLAALAAPPPASEPLSIGDEQLLALP